jgi:hypothetical protein
LWVIFALLDPDPDPATQINADPCGSGSGSETLGFLLADGRIRIRTNNFGFGSDSRRPINVRIP